PSPHLLDVRQALPSTSAAPAGPTLWAAERETVISHSRETYARTRSDVEAEIARINGWDQRPAVDKPPESEEQAALRQRLLGTGVSREHALLLLTQFDSERIRRQLDW